MEKKKSYEESKEELNRLYKEGKIDKFFYDKEIVKLDYKIKQITKREEANKVQELKNKASVIIVILILIVSLGILLLVNGDKNLKYKKEYEKVASFDRLPSPVQKAVNGKKVEKITLDGNNYNVELVYEYTIYGRVVDTLTYEEGKGKQTDVVPKDVGLVWGPMAQDKFKKLFYFESKLLPAGRILKVIPKNDQGSEVLNNLGLEYISNNHIFGSDERTEELIYRIKKNDYIKIEGYLCSVSETYLKQMNSRVVKEREDVLIQSSFERGDSECETIYVTDVKWLKEK